MTITRKLAWSGRGRPTPTELRGIVENFLGDAMLAMTIKEVESLEVQLYGSWTSPFQDLVWVTLTPKPIVRAFEVYWEENGMEVVTYHEADWYTRSVADGFFKAVLNQYVAVEL